MIVLVWSSITYLSLLLLRVVLRTSPSSNNSTRFLELARGLGITTTSCTTTSRSTTEYQVLPLVLLLRVLRSTSNTTSSSTSTTSSTSTSTYSVIVVVLVVRNMELSVKISFAPQKSSDGKKRRK